MGVDRTRDRLTEGLTGPLLDAGYDLEALQVTPAGRRRVVRIAIDRDGGITLDDVAEASKTIARLLDDEADLGAALGQQPYTLEVTSPGVDRPLTHPRHWRRNIGRLVKITVTDPDTSDGTVTGTGTGTGTGTTTLIGRIAVSDEGGVDLDIDQTTRRVAYDQISKALVQIEFNRTEED